LNNQRNESYGQSKLTFVDRLGVWLSERAIARELPKQKDLEVLELGCGFRATHLVALSPRLKRGVGVDFKIAPDLANRPNLLFHETTIEEALSRLGGQTFDVVLLISVLEHLRDPLSVLQATRHLLKASGILLINVPTWRGKAFLEFSALRLGLSPKVEIDDHKMYYDKRDLWPLLVRAGFLPSLIKLQYHKLGLNLFAVARPQDA
jgi:SAM-dependent methyltransferase